MKRSGTSILLQAGFICFSIPWKDGNILRIRMALGQLKLPAARLRRTGNLRMEGKMHRIRSLTPLQAAGNALAMHVQKDGYEIMIFSIKHVKNCIISWLSPISGLYLKIHPHELTINSSTITNNARFQTRSLFSNLNSAIRCSDVFSARSIMKSLIRILLIIGDP